MGFYERRILPRFVDKVCGVATLRPLRERVCAGLTGDVLEIGFGSGHNIGYYPATVTSVTALEPSDLAWELAGPRVQASPIPISRAGLDGARLPFDDGRFDCALSTFTLCTVTDPATALREIRRVLRPGGALHFLEHGLAPDADVRRWQDRLTPLQKRLAGGCHLNRPIVELVAQAGFTVRTVEEFYDQNSPRFWAADSLGVAVA
jgi:ubiquinone/menaquinone biosynthesis C-methylase UbiE